MGSNKKVILIILDGFGMSAQDKGNAVLAAQTPIINSIFFNTPPLLLQASGEAVGLPFGEVGNSEVGHLTLGSGRIISQDFTQISDAIQSQSFFQKRALIEVMEHVKQNNSNLHLAGILTESGVHGHLHHLMALLDLAKMRKVKNVYIHLFADGRDSPPQSAALYIKKLEEKIAAIGVGKIASLCGRYFSMDRDKNWERTQVAFDLIAALKGQRFRAPEEALKAAYERGENDENLAASVVEGAKPLSGRDGLIMYNFRADRMVQIAEALTNPDFGGFKRPPIPDLKAAIFTEYDYNVRAQVAFTCFDLNNPAVNPLTNSLAQILSQNNLTQLHAAETEKFAHTTYFFNASRQEPFRGEERILIPSPKVANFDQKPEMSASQLAEKFIQAIQAKKHHFGLVNFANADMVGHTGNFEAAKKAIETIDFQLKKIITALAGEYAIIITSDHGNADEMLTIDNKISKEHSVNPVPLAVITEPIIKQGIGNEVKLESASQTPVGILADAAVTVLNLMQIEKPSEMTGNSLL